MTAQTITTVIDFGALAIVIIFAAIGLFRGMFQMIAALAILILSFLGATYIAANFSGAATDFLAPFVEERVTTAMQDAMSGDNLNRLVTSYAAERSGGDLETAFENSNFSSLKFDYLSKLFSRLSDENSLPQSVTDALQERFADMRRSFDGTVSQAVSNVIKDLLRPVVYGVLYVISLFLLRFLLKFAFQFLNFAATETPVLHSVNAAGGLLLGLIEGVVVLIILAFLLRYAFVNVDGVAESKALHALALWFPTLAFP